MEPPPGLNSSPSLVQAWKWAGKGLCSRPARSRAVEGVERQESGEASQPKGRLHGKEPSQMGKKRDGPEIRAMAFKGHIQMCTHPSPALGARGKECPTSDSEFPVCPLGNSKEADPHSSVTSRDLSHHQWQQAATFAENTNPCPFPWLSSPRYS